MAAIRLEFAQFGHFDSFDVIRSMTSMVGTADADLPTPIATSLKTMYYVDADVIKGLTYYYRVRVWRGSTSFVSDEVKIIADRDEYWVNVTSLLHFDSNITDQKGIVWSNINGATLDYTEKVFGESSLSLTSSSYLRTAARPEFNFGTGAFVVEARVFVPSGQTYNENEIPIMAAGAQNTHSSNGGWNFALFDKSSGATMRFEMCIAGGGAPNVEFTFSPSMPRDQWFYVCIERDGTGKTRGYYNDAKVGESMGLSGVDVKNPNNKNVLIGASSNGANETFFKLVGRLDEIRVTKGVTRYGDSFTLHSRPFPDK
jgi:hypothetical protein